jgi:hypothetical protein
MLETLKRMLSVLAVLALVGPVATATTAGAPAVPSETGVYEEDFSTYTYKDYVENAEWDVWAQALRLARTDGTSQSWSIVAMDGSGNAFVIWTDGRNGQDDIYAQKLDSRGNILWAVDVRVNSDSGAAYQQFPAVAVDRNGNAVVVWEDYRNGATDIYTQKLDGNGTRLWAADVRVNSGSGTAYQRYPAVAVDGSGNVIVAWEDYRNGVPDIYTQKLDGNGTWLWAADVRVNSDGGTAYQQYPVVAMDGSGNAVIVWVDDRNGHGNIYAQKLDGNGNWLWAADVQVNSDSGTATQWFPAVAVDGSGNDIVVWEDYRNGAPHIYAQKLGGNGNWLWAADVQVSSEGGTGYQRFPAVAVDRSGNAIVVWENYRGGDSSDIYAQKLDGNGNRLWAASVRVSSNSGTASQWSPAVAVDGSGKAIVVWHDYRNGDGDIYAQKLDGSGNWLWSADMRVNSDSGTAVQRLPAVAVDRSGNTVIVWTDERNGDQDIYAQKLNGDGNGLWPIDIRTNSDGGTAHQGEAAVAVDENGNAIVVWHDERSDNLDKIYAQKLNASGDKLWGTDVYINRDSGASNQYDPAVAVDGSGNAIIVWEDYRNSYGDIYAQKLDDNGSKLWLADTRVNSDNGTTHQSMPTVAIDGSGDAFVAWDDGRNGNPDVFAQRVNVVGGKIWLADLQVVYPDRFYLPAGIAQSRSVDTSAGNIAQANLTADYQTNGGGVQFYLTNDGGAHWAQATPGVTHVFTTTGSDLRWRAALTADPVWLRTPVVNSLHIEYSTQAPPADDYEPDDTCGRASPLQVNGAAQAHTFHQHADGDWTWFEAITGTAYLVQAVHTGSEADLELELHDACGQPPLPPDDEDTFGNDAHLVFTAPTAGVYYVKAVNHDPAVYGEHTGYLLSVRTQSPAPVVTIVAGRNERAELESNITFMGDQAYRTFRRAGVPRENIRYLSVGSNRDADQDGHLDVDGTPTWQNVRYAVQDWPRERGVRLGVPFYLYLVDHGGTDYYCAHGCAAGKRVSASDLDLWLSNLEATTGADQINVIIEACYSGSFIDVTTVATGTVSSQGRVVIASTGSGRRAFPSERGGYFSDAFFTALGDNADLRTAYEAGRTAAQAAWSEQTPWLDDNGDTVADGRDGLIARGRGLASFGGGAVPVVDWLRVGEVSESGVATITAQVRDDVAVVTVTAEVYGPGLTVPETGEGETPVLPVERVVLQDGDHDGVYAGTHTGFTEEGVYRLVAYAWDNDGNLSLPREVTVGEQKVYLPLVVRGN